MAVGVGSNPGVADRCGGAVWIGRYLKTTVELATSSLLMPVPRPGVVARACLPMPLSEAAKHQASPDKS